jgi:3-oxoacyl-[acyl-carrier protein] reductase
MLKVKTALITGASRGIGRGIAIKFAEHGAFIGINYILNDDRAKETLKFVREKGGDGILLKGDVSNPRDVEKIVKTLIDKSKHIDILVNNAGIYQRNNFENLKYETWSKVLSINLTSCYHLCKQVIPYMKSNSRIIFISSQLAFKGSLHGADYATTKAGILGFMRSLALELADKKILVNAVAPGTIDTDIISGYTEKMKHQRIKEIPLQRLGTPEDVANVCLFLASDLSNYITGETINVNGGLYIH